MTDTEIRIRYEEIIGNLAERRLRPAFRRLGRLISENGFGEFYDEALNLEQTYRYMLQYTLEGIKDPEREKVYRHLIISTYQLADKVREVLMMKHSLSIEYQKKRAFANRYISDLNAFLVDLEAYQADAELNTLLHQTISGDRKELDESLSHQEENFHLFYHLWFKDLYEKTEAGSLREFFISDLPELPYKSLMVSGVTLGLLRYFDESKFSLLFDFYHSQETEIKQRALVGLLLCFCKYDKRIGYYPEIIGRLEILNEDPEFKRDLERVIRQFIRTRETEKIQKKIRDEIIPEMIKISPNLKNKINLENLMDQGLGDDKNPEWEELFKDSPGLMDKMEEFSQLQMEGADVFLSSFAMLKSFPFFNEPANWFIPYFIDNPMIAANSDTTDPVNRKFLQIIGGAPILCNSDKHSFCFSIKNLPAESREMLARGMEAEMDQLNELEKDEELTSPGKIAEYISNQYIQDLYRFYKLYPKRADFEDIFSWKFDFYNKTGIGEILKEDTKILRNIAEYYFAKSHYEDAASVYRILLGNEKTGELYQKAAYCQQKQGNYKKALKLYLKAELYGLNNLWNLKKIAFCYRTLKEPAKALEYYRQAEIIDPENLNIQLSIGNCLLELNQFSEALKCYFKIEYLSPGDKNVRRPIAWCSFVTGKLEQAKNYYGLLLEDAPTKYDLMNLGHVEWCLGDRKTALDNYKKSILETGLSESEFFEVFEEDKQHLLNQGVDPGDIPIILDLLRYSIEQ